MENQNEIIYNKLMTMSEDIGSIKTHVEKIGGMETRIATLEATKNRQAGFIGAINKAWLIAIALGTMFIAWVKH